MEENPYQRNVFNLIVIYRWVSLIPAIYLLLGDVENNLSFGSSWMIPTILGAVVVVNTIISIYSRSLNKLLIKRPYVLTLDLLFTAGLLALSGGVNSPYYLYSLNPLIAGAFFFQIRGGLLAALIFTPAYLSTAYFLSDTATTRSQANATITQLMGIWLIPVLVGYLSYLLARLRSAHDALIEAQSELQSQNESLRATHSQLKTIYDLTVMLQAAPDVKSVQRQVLTAATQAYGFERAALGVYTPGGEKIGLWEVSGKDIDEDKTSVGRQFLALSVDGTDSPLAQAIGTGQFYWLSRAELDAISPQLSTWLNCERGLLMPLIFHEQPVGTLLLANPVHSGNLSNEQTTLLKILANQAATTLGTTMLCVERAQELAVEQERSRIARDIHDTVAQSLFGIVYTLDGCIQMLPEDAGEARRELLELQKLANQTRDQIRQSIFDLWPSSLTVDVFKSDLNKYIKRCFSLNPFEIDYQVEGIFDELAPAIRRNLYRITQEALSNVIHHSGVDTAKVCLTIDQGWAQVDIKDQGRGFDVDEVLAREYNRERFGLHGIQERVRMLGGEFAIQSTPGLGTNISIRVPVNGG